MIILAMVFSCLDPYNPPASQVNVNYLVVEGFLNSNGLTEIQLGRTHPVKDANPAIPETGALVQVAGVDGSIFTLSGDNSGSYFLAAGLIDSTRQFQLKIKTSDQKEYTSDFVSVKNAPAIDTVRYDLTGEDLHIYLSTHDVQNKSLYYLWRFVETWKYNSRYPSEFVFNRATTTVSARPSLYDLFFCWSTAYSNKILISSSAKLAQDVIHDFPVNLLNVHSEKLQLKYSILIEQYALTSDGYQYWQQLKKSTETIGSIFDPQPSQSPTNIHCISNPDEPVVGYFSASSVQRKRIFIKSEDLPNVRRSTVYDECVNDTLLLADVPAFDGNDLLITGVYAPRGATLLGYLKARPFCVDCRINNGTTVMPGFWK